MRLMLYAFAMCQSMFCAIPCPWNVWDEKARDKMLLFLPVVGLEIGIIWMILGYVCQFFGLSTMITGAILCIVPYLATGFMHMDGFMDVTDAVKSCRNLERRREILKDSHVGSFAVIHCCILIVLQFAFLTELTPTGVLPILVFIPIVSRCCSVLAIMLLPAMNTSQYNQRIKKTSHILVIAAMLIITLFAGFLCCGIYGLALIGGLVGHIVATRYGYRSLKGMNGDISGYAITVSELLAVACIAFL